MENILGCFDALIDMVIIQTEDKLQLTKINKEVNDDIDTLKASTKALFLLAEKDYSEENLDKIRRNLLSMAKRLDDSEKLHGDLSPINTLFKEDTQSKLRLVGIINEHTKLIKDMREESVEVMLKLKEAETRKEMDEGFRIPL